MSYGSDTAGAGSKQPIPADAEDERALASSRAVTRQVGRQSRKDSSRSVGYDKSGEDRDPSDDFNPDVERPDDSDESDNIMDLDETGAHSQSSVSDRTRARASTHFVLGCGQVKEGEDAERKGDGHTSQGEHYVAVRICTSQRTE